MSVRGRLTGAVRGFMAGGYDGARDTRERPTAQMRGARAVDEDRQIGSWDRARLRRECEDLARNNAIVAGIRERFADNVVTAAHPQAKTTNRDWNKLAERNFQEWEKIADSRRRLNFWQMKRLVVKSQLTAGQHFQVLTDAGQLQPVEADRVVTPAGFEKDARVVEGIRLTADGIPLEYAVCPRDGNGYVDNKSPRWIASRDIIHTVMADDRADMVHGIPKLAPVINALRDFGTLTNNTLQKSIMDSARGWAIYSEDGAAKIAQLGPRNATPDAKATGQTYEYIANGQTYYLRNNEKIESLASNTPNATYIPYNELLLRLVGCALSLPYEFLLITFKDGSFSASKAALALAYKTFLNWHTWLTESYSQRVWNWVTARAIKEGRLPPAPLDGRGMSTWYQVYWPQPAYDWLDPQAQALSDIYGFALGAESLSSIAAKKGGDSEDVLAAKGDNYLEAAREMQRVNGELEKLGLKERVTLDHFIQAKVPPGVVELTPQQVEPELRDPTPETRG